MKILDEIAKVWSSVFMSVLLGMVVYEGTEYLDLIEYAILIGIGIADFRITREVLVDITDLIRRLWKEAKIKKLSVNVKGA